MLPCISQQSLWTVFRHYSEVDLQLRPCLQHVITKVTYRCYKHFHQSHLPRDIFNEQRITFWKFCRKSQRGFSLLLSNFVGNRGWGGLFVYEIVGLAHYTDREGCKGKDSSNHSRFNYSGTDWWNGTDRAVKERKFINWLQKHFIVQFIEATTRHDALLDLVIASNVEPNVNDHSLNQFNFKLQTTSAYWQDTFYIRTEYCQCQTEKRNGNVSKKL